MAGEATGRSEPIGGDTAAFGDGSSTEEVAGTYVYVIGEPRGPQKIGISRNVDIRLSELKSGYNHNIKVLFKTQEPMPRANAFRVEALAHSILSEHRVIGEWFNVTPQVAIQAVLDAIIQFKEAGLVSIGKPAFRAGEALSIRVPSDIKAALLERAAAEERSITTIIIRAVREYLDGESNGTPRTPSRPPRPTSYRQK